MEKTDSPHTLPRRQFLRQAGLATLFTVTPEKEEGVVQDDFILVGGYRFQVNREGLPACYWDREGKKMSLDIQAMALAKHNAIATGESVIATMFEYPKIRRYPSTKEHPLYDELPEPAIEAQELFKHGVRVINPDNTELLLHKGVFGPGELLEGYPIGGRAGLDIVLVDAPLVNPIILDNDPRYAVLEDRMPGLRDTFNRLARKTYKDPGENQLGKELFEQGMDIEFFRREGKEREQRMLELTRTEMKKYGGKREYEEHYQRASLDSQTRLLIWSGASNLNLAKIMARILPGTSSGYFNPPISEHKNRASWIICVGGADINFHNMIVSFNKKGVLNIYMADTRFSYHLKKDNPLRPEFSHPDPSMYKIVPQSPKDDNPNPYLVVDTRDPVFDLYHEGMHGLLYQRGNTNKVLTALPNDYTNEALTDSMTLEMLKHRHKMFVASGYNPYMNNTMAFKLPESNQYIEI